MQSLQESLFYNVSNCFWQTLSVRLSLSLLEFHRPVAYRLPKQTLEQTGIAVCSVFIVVFVACPTERLASAFPPSGRRLAVWLACVAAASSLIDSSACYMPVVASNLGDSQIVQFNWNSCKEKTRFFRIEQAAFWSHAALLCTQCVSEQFFSFDWYNLYSISHKL